MIYIKEVGRSEHKNKGKGKQKENEEKKNRKRVYYLAKKFIYRRLGT